MSNGRRKQRIGVDDLLIRLDRLVEPSIARLYLRLSNQSCRIVWPLFEKVLELLPHGGIRSCEIDRQQCQSAARFVLARKITAGIGGLLECKARLFFLT